MHNLREKHLQWGEIFLPFRQQLVRNCRWAKTTIIYISHKRFDWFFLPFLCVFNAENECRDLALISSRRKKRRKNVMIYVKWDDLSCIQSENAIECVHWAQIDCFPTHLLYALVTHSIQNQIINYNNKNYLIFAFYFHFFSTFCSIVLSCFAVSFLPSLVWEQCNEWILYNDTFNNWFSEPTYAFECRMHRM